MIDGFAPARAYELAPFEELEARANELARLADAGETPEIAAGFRLVIDSTPLEALTADKLIPVVPYTGYLARGEFAIASVDNINRSHDLTHLALLLEIFERSALLPGILQRAAINCGEDLEKCRVFTRALDELPAEYLLARAAGEKPDVYHLPKTTTKQYLHQFVELDLGADAPRYATDVTVQDIWDDLGFGAAEITWNNHPPAEIPTKSTPPRSLTELLSALGIKLLLPLEDTLP